MSGYSKRFLAEREHEIRLLQIELEELEESLHIGLDPYHFRLQELLIAKKKIEIEIAILSLNRVRLLSSS